MSLFPHQTIKLLQILRSSTVQIRIYVIWLSNGFRQHKPTKHFKVHVCKFSYKPWHVHLELVTCIFSCSTSLRQLMDPVWKAYQSWIYQWNFILLSFWGLINFSLVQIEDVYFHTGIRIFTRASIVDLIWAYFLCKYIFTQMDKTAGNAYVCLLHEQVLWY